MTHEEAIAIAAEAAEPIAFAEYVTSDWYAKRAKERAAVAIGAYLEARSAVLCTKDVVAWELSYKNGQGRHVTKQKPAVGEGGSGTVAPLHAALSDNPNGDGNAL